MTAFINLMFWPPSLRVRRRAHAFGPRLIPTRSRERDLSIASRGPSHPSFSCPSRSRVRVSPKLASRFNVDPAKYRQVVGFYRNKHMSCVSNDVLYPDPTFIALVCSNSSPLTGVINGIVIEVCVDSVESAVASVLSAPLCSPFVK